MATGYEVEGIDQRWAGFKSVPKIIDEKFEDGRGYAQSAFRVAQETIQKLSDLAASLKPIDTNTATTLEDITPPAREDFVATAPSSPVIELNLPSNLETDDVETAVHDKLLKDIQSGGPAIPSDIEDAIFKRDSERSLLVHQDALDSISAEWAKRGFTLPNGMLNAVLAQAVIEYNNKRMDVSRDVTIKSFELGDANTKFAVEKGIQWLMTRIETYKAKVQAEIARIDAVIKKYLGQVEVYKGEAQVFMTLNDVELKRFDGELRLALAKADLVIKDASLDMKNYELLNNLKIEAMKAIGGVSAQEVAGALSSVSAGVHMSVSNAASYGYSTNPSY